jgi:hypothetical protein
MRRPWSTGGCCVKVKKKIMALQYYDVYGDFLLQEVHTRYHENCSTVSKSEMAVLTGTKIQAAKQRHGRHRDFLSAIFRFAEGSRPIA